MNREYVENVLNKFKFDAAIQQIRQAAEVCRHKIENAQIAQASNAKTLYLELIRLTNGCTFEMIAPLAGDKIIQKNEAVYSHQLQVHNYSRQIFDIRVWKCKRQFKTKSQTIRAFSRLFNLKLSRIDSILGECKESMSKSVDDVCQTYLSFRIILESSQETFYFPPLHVPEL